MSDFQQRDGAGQLFRNDRKTEEKHPTHKGTFVLDGVTYDIAAWVKEGAKGRFFSLRITQPDQVPAPRSAIQKPQAPRRSFGMKPQGGSGEGRPIPYDDIPF